MSLAERMRFSQDPAATLDQGGAWYEADLELPAGAMTLLFIGRTDAEAEAPILWPPDAKSQLIGKDPDTGKD